MTLLNAPEFDERKENRRRNIWVGSGIFVAVMAVLTVAGFLLGHGWLFTNLPAEHRVNVFLTAVQAGEYPKAFGIFNNDPKWQQHPQQYADYPLQRFTEDFTTESDVEGACEVVPCGLLQARLDGDGGGVNDQRNDQSDVEDPAFGWDDSVLSV